MASLLQPCAGGQKIYHRCQGVPYLHQGRRHQHIQALVNARDGYRARKTQLHNLDPVAITTPRYMNITLVRSGVQLEINMATPGSRPATFQGFESLLAQAIGLDLQSHD